MTGEYEKKLDDMLFDFVESLGIDNARQTKYGEVVNMSASIISMIENDDYADEKEETIENLNTRIEELEDEINGVENLNEEIRSGAETSLEDIIESLSEVIKSLDTDSLLVDKETVDKAVNKLKNIKADAELDKKEIINLY